MTKPRTPPVEQEHHRKAFEVYASQGHTRSYEKVAEALGVSVASIKQWGRTFGWRQRLQQRDAEAARQLSDRSIQSSLAERDRDLKIVRMAKMKLAKDITEGKVKGRIPDLEMLIRFEGELLGDDGDPLGALIRQLPEEVRDPVMECLRTRLTSLVAALQSTQGEKHDEAPTSAS
jgi:transposase